MFAIEGSKKRKSFDVEKEETADYRCAGCAESFAAMVALVGKGTTEVGCEDCAELLRPFEEEFAMKMQRAKQLKKASSKKKEGLRSKELVPEGAVAHCTHVYCYRMQRVQIGSCSSASCRVWWRRRRVTNARSPTRSSTRSPTSSSFHRNTALLSGDSKGNLIQSFLMR